MFSRKTASLNVPLLQSEIHFCWKTSRLTKLCSWWIKLRKIRPLSLATKRNPATKRPQQAAQYKLGNWPAPMLLLDNILSSYLVVFCFRKSNKRNHPFVAAKIEMIRTKGGMSCTSDKSYETSDGNHRNRASRIKFLWGITSHFATFSNTSHIYKWRHVKAFGLSTAKRYVPRSVLVSVLGVSTPWLKSAFSARSGRSKKTYLSNALHWIPSQQKVGFVRNKRSDKKVNNIND